MASGWWDGNGTISGCVAAYQPIGAASLAASYVNLANPGTYDAAPGTAPSFAAATGWTFNGSTQELTTGITPTNDQSWSMIVRTEDEESNGNPWICGGNSSAYFALAGRFTGTQVIYGNGAFLAPSPILVTGVLAIAGNKGYRNGTAESGTIGTQAGSFQAVRIGYAGANNRFKGKVLAFAIYSATLTSGQIATVSAAMAALTSAYPLPLHAAQLAAYA